MHDQSSFIDFEPSMQVIQSRVKRQEEEKKRESSPDDEDDLAELV